MDEEILETWARRRWAKHVLWLGAVVGMGVALAVTSAIDARRLAGDAWLAAAFVEVGLMSAVIGFQQCPRCRKFWNMRSLFGFSTPYSSRCLSCKLAAPRPKTLQRSRLTALFFVPMLSTTVLGLSLHYFTPPRVVREEVTLAELEGLRGTSAYVSLAEGVPRPEYLGTHVYVNRSHHAVYQVVPLVGAGWTASDPVRVWVLCHGGQSTGDCTDPGRFLELLEESARTGTPLQNAHVIPHGDVRARGSGWERATTHAANEHGVRSAPDALFLSWPGDPERD